jgi:hopanoid biosynthesis associated protein HpnK
MMRHTARAAPERQRYLIVNADDFGSSEAVNEAVVRAYTEGVLTSCSLMVTGEAFEHAVHLAHAHPGLAVGLHLVTVMGRAVLPPGEIPTLVDAKGYFSSNPTAAGCTYYFSPQARRELRRELAAQFQKFSSTGLRLSHIDGHLHLHVHPVIFTIALELGACYGVRRMRVPREEYRLAIGFDRQHAGTKAVHTVLFGALATWMKRQLRAHGFVWAERVYGNLHSGRMDERYFLYTLEHLRARTNEMYCHPAVYPVDHPLEADAWQGTREFAALTSQTVRRRLRELGITLINYFDLDQNA